MISLLRAMTDPLQIITDPLYENAALLRERGALLANTSLAHFKNATYRFPMTVLRVQCPPAEMSTPTLPLYLENGEGNAPFLSYQGLRRLYSHEVGESFAPLPEPAGYISPLPGLSFSLRSVRGRGHARLMGLHRVQ